MSRKRNRSNQLDVFKAKVMKEQGYQVDPNHPDQVKYEVAKSLGVPLKQGDNGHLTTESVGKVGGQIGGAMVREMVRMAQEQLAKNNQQK